MTISKLIQNSTFNEQCKSCNEMFTMLYKDGLCMECYQSIKKYQDELQRTNNKTFDSFKTSEHNSKVVDIIKSFETNQKGLYLYGPTGTGKTHLAYATYNILNNKEKSVIFKNVTELILELRQCIQCKLNKSELDVINEIVSNDYVILDDLGAENLTGYSSESLYYLINKLIELNKKTFITSNLSIKDLQLQKQNDRIPSRICELCDIIHLTGQDNRVKRIGNI